MAVRDGQEQDQVLGVKDQADPDYVPVGGVASCTPASLNLDHDAVGVVEGVYFIRYFCVSVTAEEHRTPDTLGCLLAGFHGEPEFAEASGELPENPVAVQSRLAFDGGDALLCRLDVRDERLDPLRGPRVPRELVPRGVKLCLHPAILPCGGGKGLAAP